ncbi:MAG: YfdX family protein [Epsilonproteobacteria bacterium]|nr:YfdX family protein [Campylobacterota bacterium]
MKRGLISIFVSSLLFSSISVADENVTLTSKQVTENATREATADAKSHQAKLVEEAITSLKLSAKALVELNHNKPDEAKKSIELALGKLETILSTENAPKLLPVDNRMVVKNFAGSADDVEKMVNLVKELLDKGKVQEAGELLISLQSEIDIVVVNLPLASYPDALKLASKYILQKEYIKAKRVLELALSTFTEVEYIIPIPVVNATELVSTASKIAKDNKEQALKHLVYASDELDKAEKLGYISSSDVTYKQLHELIEKTEKEIKGPNKAEKLFSELIEKLQEFKSKILPAEKGDSK